VSEAVVMRLAVLGATGDLTARLLLPALARVQATGALPDGFRILGVDRADLDDASYREHVDASLAAHAKELDPDERRAFVGRVGYRRADVTDPRALATALSGDEPVVVHLALPPAVFAPAIAALGGAGLPPGSRLVVEKPFGTDLKSAEALNRTIAESLPGVPVHRVDHFLSKQTVQNLLGLRFANRVLEPIWSRHHVERVEIVWDEKLTVETRAGYYDRAGALRDMVQNHLLQLLALVAMEPPATLGERDLRDGEADVLRAVRQLDPEEVAKHTVRARYTAGRIGEREVPDYVAEPGIDPGRETETFAAVTLFVDNWRWAGVPFQLRTGKALGQSRKEIAIHFQPVPHLAFGDEPPPRPNTLRLRLDPDVMTLELVTNGAGDPFDLEETDLELTLAPQDIPAYGRVLLDALTENVTFAIRGDEAEESWKIVEPILGGWAAGRAPLKEYAAGSNGPDGLAPRPGG